MGVILLEKKWHLPDEARQAEGESSLTRSLLFARGIRSNEEISKFLSRQPNDWHDPFLMNDMQPAVDRICQAVTSAEKILICGDYDADGVTSTAILMSFLRKVRANVDYVIPDRVSEGYGISEPLTSRIEAHQPKLLITVDCGVANEDAVLRLMEEGLDVIVTDHHEVKDSLPPALAVIDCKRKDNTYPFIHLCGAGVALKVVAACCTKLTGRVEMEEWKNYIDIAAIGTIADVVSITGENRTIVKEGLRLLARTNRPGIRALFAIVRQNASNPSAPISSTEIAFQIAPKINACGRLGDASRAVELLLTTDTKRAQELAEELNRENTRRQELEQAVLEEAVAKIESDRQMIEQLKNNSMPIVVAGDNWHVGILGIVANRLVNRYQRSAIVFTKDPGEKAADGSSRAILKGSCRTAGDFPILECLKYCGDAVWQYGGHKRAAGVSVSEDQFEEFQKRVSAFAKERKETHADDDLQFIEVDRKLLPSELTLESAEEILGLEPFGEGNREPVFLLSGLKITQTKVCGATGRHLKMTLACKDEETGEIKSLDAIAFGQGEWVDMFVPGSMIDALVELGVHSWNGNDSLSLQVIDMHFMPIGKTIWDTPQVLENLYRNKLPLRQVAMIGKCKEEELLPNGEEMGILYRYLKENCTSEANMCDMHLLARLLTGKFKKPLHAFKISRAMDIFREAGLLDLLRLNDERICFSLLSVQDKVKLEDTKTYRALYGTSGQKQES